MTTRWLCLFICTVVFLCTAAQAAVMSIDYGTEWFKVGLIKPGRPLDVALNKDSKRKTQSVVTIRNDERIYGSDAVSLAGRFPQLTYSNLKSIVGKRYDDPVVQEFRRRYVNEMSIDSERNMPIFIHNGTTHLSIEELIAYQFQHARSQASAAAGENVKDCVITVTPFANQYERQAIIDAAELAGLNVLTLMHDETAVALNYAVSREIGKTPENHIFYDMGAGSTVASIVTFSNVEIKDGKITRTSPQLEVKGVGFDRTLGGHEFDVRLQQLLIAEFMKANKDRINTDIRTSSSAMTRLMKEANRVKQILSANTETMASIESLHEDLDFKVKVTRAQLESICQDLIARANNPIATALEAANMTVDDIQSVVLVGGGVRVPSIQKQLVDLVGAQKIAKNVNGDEAAVLGAAFRGASLSNQFRLSKQITIKDVTLFPIDISYKPENKGKEAASAVDTTIVSKFDSINMRKIMTFNRVTDFEFGMTYGKNALAGMDGIAKVKVTGLTEAMNKHKDDIKATEIPPKVRVTFELSNSGIISVTEASLHIGKKSFKDKVKSFFSGKDTKDSKAEKKIEDEVNKQNETSVDDNKNNNITTTNTKESITIDKIPLTIEYIPVDRIPLTEKDKAIAKNRINELDALDTRKRLREESRNALETFVYRVQDFLYNEVVEIVTTKNDIEKFRERLSETSDWLYDEGEHADTPVYVRKLKELQLIEQPIQHRVKEYNERENNINTVKTVVTLAREFVNKIRGEVEDARYHTEEELEGLLIAAEKLENWMAEKVAAQKKFANTEDPVLLTSDVLVRSNGVKDHLTKLITKKKPKITKKTSEDDNKNNSGKEGDNNNNNTTEQNASQTSSAETDASSTNNAENEEHTHDEL
ncbi:Hsp70 protein-domain-containing protein [Cokeromyces recurvatus]|uniref:Hsp70 protein-domain-containing protein n=1 Tax=Cokeromyces recurvatus TaxID=90255 RepID=UPI00221F3666|nr:Hsp70 protein-domain-containing protein [Cokeromyces recurvatus]KAI7901695.1 Hsp70 protein-domain-containing protein [Cokeromyces recurvatus]